MKKYTIIAMLTCVITNIHASQSNPSCSLITTQSRSDSSIACSTPASRSLSSGSESATPQSPTVLSLILPQDCGYQAKPEDLQATDNQRHQKRKKVVSTVLSWVSLPKPNPYGDWHP